jgi:hypothetical protein
MKDVKWQVISPAKHFDPKVVAEVLRDQVDMLVAGMQYTIDGSLVEIGSIDTPPDLSQMGVQMVSEVEKPIVKTVAFELEPTVKESFTVAVEPEPVIKESLTTASNDPEIPDSSNSSGTPNSSIDNHSVDASKMVMDGPTETQQKPDVPETDFANMQDEKITIGYTVPNAYQADAEPITKPIERKRVLYIAGPMRGVAWFNYPMFDRVAKELREAGNEVISPADEDRKQDGFDPFANPSHVNPDACTFPHQMDFGKTVRRCLDAVLRCDELVLLPDWHRSKGALAELALAAWLGKRVRQVSFDDTESMDLRGYWLDNYEIAHMLAESFWPGAVEAYNNWHHSMDEDGEYFEHDGVAIDPSRVTTAGPIPSDDEDILAEASRITRGSRQAQYGPPDQDFRRTAGMWSALFGLKLKDGVTFEPRDVALAMILLKTSRETHQRKRDNWVDIAGYASCGSRCN